MTGRYRARIEEQPLTLDELVVTLDHWAGEEVAIRVVSNSHDLIAVFHGELGTQSTEKQPALFWPLLHPAADPHDHSETPGVYVHPDRFDEAALHIDKTVLELRQDAVTLNIRRH
jgi:hypothetical protein